MPGLMGRQDPEQPEGVRESRCIYGASGANTVVYAPVSFASIPSPARQLVARLPSRLLPATVLLGVFLQGVDSGTFRRPGFLKTERERIHTFGLLFLR
jgi:hypothetical protein